MTLIWAIFLLPGKPLQERPRSNQEQPGATKSSQKAPESAGKPRRAQESPEAAPGMTPWCYTLLRCSLRFRWPASRTGTPGAVQEQPQAKREHQECPGRPGAAPGEPKHTPRCDTMVLHVGALLSQVSVAETGSWRRGPLSYSLYITRRAFPV